MARKIGLSINRDFRAPAHDGETVLAMDLIIAGGYPYPNREPHRGTVGAGLHPNCGSSQFSPAARSTFDATFFSARS